MDNPHILFAGNVWDHLNNMTLNVNTAITQFGVPSGIEQ